MNRYKSTGALLLLLLLACSGAAQKKSKTTGSIKGKVRSESGASAEGVKISVRQGEREVASATTDRKGQFEVAELTPGRYALTFRKPGLSVAEIKDIEVNAGKTRTLNGNLVLPVDEGSLIFVKGGVFTEAGHTLPGAQVELARIEADGSLKSLAGRITTASDSFAVRLQANAARYRVTEKMLGMVTASKDVEVEGAAIYRVALTLTPAP